MTLFPSGQLILAYSVLIISIQRIIGEEAVINPAESDSGILYSSISMLKSITFEAITPNFSKPYRITIVENGKRENFFHLGLTKNGLTKVLNIFLPLSHTTDVRKLILNFIQEYLPAKMYDCIIFRSILLNYSYFGPVEESRPFFTNVD